MDYKFYLLVLIPTVLAAVLLVLNAVKDKTETDADNKAASLIEKILSFFGKKPE